MNDETILILGIILLGVGAIIGALTYHLIVYRFWVSVYLFYTNVIKSMDYKI